MSAKTLARRKKSAPYPGEGSLPPLHCIIPKQAFPGNHNVRTRNRECLEQCWIKHCHTTAYSKSVYFGKIASEDFCPSPPPIRSILQKIGKIQNRLRMAWNGEKSKKNIFPLVTPPPKNNLEKFPNFFFKIFLKVVQNHLKRRENWKSWKKNFQL